MSVLLGVVVAFALVGLIESIGHRLYPVPPGINVADPEQLRAYMRDVPLGAMLMVLVAWVVSTFVGGVAAAQAARAKPMKHALIVGAFVLGATILNLAIIPHPVWFAITGVVGVALSAYVAGRRMEARQAKRQASLTHSTPS